jgi:ribosomal protein L11 methyltransferase
MRWIELTATFSAEPEDWSPIVDLLGGLGCPNTLVADQPPSITACLLEVEGWEANLHRLESELRAAGALNIEHTFIEEANWAESYKAHFHPRRVGRRFVIQPTWETAEPNPGDLTITLDPGLAFGTGDHPTTRLCLELLEKTEVEGKRVADVGCGTGILSIGAVRLGAREVAGVDIEAQSVEVARENAERNGVSYKLVVGDGIAAIGQGPWDLVLSNIISATLISLAPQVFAALAPNGGWIVSGILVDNWPDVLKAAERAGFVLTARLEEGQWVAASFRRP